MTLTIKERARRARNNPTPAEDLLWQEIRGLNTAARWTRKKSRYGVMLDFYCRGLDLGIVIRRDVTGMHPNKRARHEIHIDAAQQLSVSVQGPGISTVHESEILAAPGRIRVDITRWAYGHLRLRVLSSLDAEPIKGIEAVDIVKGELTFTLSSGTEDTTELRNRLADLTHWFAPGAFFNVVPSVPAAPSTEPIEAQEQATA